MERYPDLLRTLLLNRGITSVDAAEKFLHPDYERDLHDPFLILNMERAVERILRAIANGERISIGAGTKIGERCYLWAGDTVGRITIGAHCRLAPEVFVTASDYSFAPGERFVDRSSCHRFHLHQGAA